MNVADFSIVEVRLSDISLLQDISQKTFLETFSVYNTEENMATYLRDSLSIEKLEKEMAQPGSQFYFAKKNERIIGYLKLNTGAAQNELKEDNALEIERIYVLSEFHGKGVGQSLYQEAITIAREKNVDYVWLGVWEHNNRAIAFYNKNGFEVFDRHLFRLGDDVQTDYMMKKRLDQ